VDSDPDTLVAVRRKDVDLDTKEGREMAMLDNLTTQVNLAWDKAELESISDQVEGFDVGEWGLNLDVADAVEELNVEEDDFGEGEGVQPVCQRGDVWQLGNHRLMCGDSTSAEDVDKLMNGETADMWLTDPPYNVNLSDKVEAMNEYMKNIGEYKLGGIETAIKNDAMSDEDFVKFLICTFNIASDHLKPGGAFYVWTAQGHNQLQFAYALDSVGLLFRQQIIWKKKEAVLGRQDYQWRHEPCFYGWKEGAGHYFVNLRNQNTVIEDEEEIDLNKMKKEELKDLCKRLLERPHEESVITEGNLQRNHLHPTMKPVRLFGRLVRNSSKPDQIILDTFGGSGTTIIACEQLNRKARLMELDPHYCDVIIARWEKLTGQKAIKLNK
jgi:DNA modification methylase